MRHDVLLFSGLLAVMILLGFAAARWRPPQSIHTLEEWGVGGRAFGNWVTWFLLGGSLYTAYTFVAVPSLTYGAGAIGFFAIPFALITCPLAYLISVRIWSVSHVHGFVTPAEFARARFGSRGLAAMIAVTGIIATMPYVAVQLIALQAVFRVLGVSGEWPLLVAVGLVSVCTFRSGLRAPALLSIAKDVLLVWLVLAVVLMVAMYGGWGPVFDQAEARFATGQVPGRGLILGDDAHLGYLTLIIGSALSVFAYPHAVTGILAAKDRATVKRNTAALPIYVAVLGLMGLLGFFAMTRGITPLDGDLNTVVPQVFLKLFPAWCAGILLAALAVAALIPAAVMSISAANLFSRSIYREYLRPNATPREEARVSQWTSLLMKVGATAIIFLLDPEFSTEFQLIGSTIILQTIPAVLLGLYTNWYHRFALMAGLVVGLLVSLAMLFDIKAYGAGGRVVKEHFGGSAWPLSNFGWDTGATVYVGLVALVVNVLVVVLLTVFLRALRVPAGPDATRPQDYTADADDPEVKRLDQLLDGLAAQAGQQIPSQRPAPRPARMNVR